MTDQGPDVSHSNTRPLIIIGVAMLLLCLGGCALSVIAERTSPYTGGILSYGTRVCVGSGGWSYTQVGVAWEVPRQTVFMSSLGSPLLHSRTTVCAKVPIEIPFLPIRGALAWPPLP